MNMTEAQMRKRIAEIDIERDKLRLEKQKYENYFNEKKKEEELSKHKEYIGKYFMSRDLLDNENKYIKAFKVLEVLEEENERYAVCLVLVDGYRYTCFEEHGIQIMTVGLWTANKQRMISNPADLKIIDFYKEITKEEFDKLADSYLKNIVSQFKEN